MCDDGPDPEPKRRTRGRPMKGKEKRVSLTVSVAPVTRASIEDQSNHEGKSAGELLDELFTIQCGACGQSNPVFRFKVLPISGELPANEFQCPNCSRAFARRPRKDRKPWDPFIELVPIPSRL